MNKAGRSKECPHLAYLRSKEKRKRIRKKRDADDVKNRGRKQGQIHGQSVVAAGGQGQ